MASYEYNKKTKKWSVRFYVKETEDKRVYKRLRGFDRKIDAETAYRQAMIEYKAPEKQGSMTVAELCVLYEQYAATEVRSSTLYNNMSAIRHYVLPYFADKKINQLTMTDVHKWHAEILKLGLKYNYISKIHTTLSLLLNYAMEYHNLTQNVASKVGNFKNDEEHQEMKFWTLDEFEKFIATFKDDILWKTFFSFLYLTGCRKGEALALNWKDIDFGTSTLKIRKNLSRKGMHGGAYKITPPKNKTSTRNVLLPRCLIDLLLQYQDHCRTCDGYNDTCFVFGTDKPLADETIRRTLRAHATKATVSVIRIHDLRHSHASLLIDKGQNILIVSQRLGHKDITQTLNTYSHLMPNTQEKIIASLEISL